MLLFVTQSAFTSDILKKCWDHENIELFNWSIPSCMHPVSLGSFLDRFVIEWLCVCVCARVCVCVASSSVVFLFPFFRAHWSNSVFTLLLNQPAVLETQEMWVQSLGQKTPWRRKWQPTPVFLPGEFHGQRSLEGYSPGDHRELSWTWLSKEQ